MFSCQKQLSVYDNSNDDQINSYNNLLNIQKSLVKRYLRRKHNNDKKVTNITINGKVDIDNAKKLSYSPFSSTYKSNEYKSLKIGDEINTKFIEDKNYIMKK